MPAISYIVFETFDYIVAETTKEYARKHCIRLSLVLYPHLGHRIRFLLSMFRAVQLDTGLSRGYIHLFDSLQSGDEL